MVQVGLVNVQAKEQRQWENHVEPTRKSSCKGVEPQGWVT
jgi:hypothetical protein